MLRQTQENLQPDDPQLHFVLQVIAIILTTLACIDNSRCYCCGNCSDDNQND